MLRSDLSLLCLCATTLVASLASAHAVGLSRSEWTERGTAINARFFFAAGEVQSLDRARELVATGLQVAREGSCTQVGTDAHPAAQDGVEVDVELACPRSLAPLHVDLRDLLKPLKPGHRHLAANQVAFETSPEVLVVPERAVTSSATLVPVGVEHILTGADHVLFVIALLLGLGSLRATLKAVTAFTVGHSLTLAVASVSQWAPSPKLVEPLIALSIVYVALENLWALAQGRPNSHRWLVALMFGLVHGFGFAGALRELSISSRDLPGALFGFNVGVELGQFLILLPAMVLLALAAKKPALRRTGVAMSSLLVAVPGMFWFVARVAEALS